MTQYLRIDSSARSADSITRNLADTYLANVSNDNVDVLNAAEGFPIITEAWVGANFTPADDRSAEQKAILAQSDALIAQLKQADTLVIGLPIYNFSVPASLKTWIDLICRAGVTFQYTEKGPEGLLTGKSAVLLVASGGVPVDSPVDFATPYVRQVLNFIGITDIQVIAADGLGGEPNKLDTVKQQLEASRPSA